METDKRQETRYEEIGKVVVPELCALPGILDDISLSGCKVHFPFIVPVDVDAEYKLNIALSRTPEEPPLQLLCKPCWVNDVEDITYVGFNNLYSPDEQRLKDFIEYLENLNSSDIPDIL